MAELVKAIEPTEKEYLVKLTQSEVDFIIGIMHDFADNPQRKVSMKYGVDDNNVIPTPKAMKVVNSLLSGMAGTEGDNYDYFDYWHDAPWT